MSPTSDPPTELRAAPRVQPRDEQARRRSSGRRRRTERAERLAIYAVATAAGLVAAFAPTMLVPVAPVAALLRAAIAFGVTLAGSRARRWTWLVIGGVGVLVSTDGVWLAVAGAAVGVAFVSVFLPRRRILGAVAVGLAVQPLFHIPDLGGEHLSTVVGVAAVGPVLASAYFVSPRRVRRRVHRALLVGLAVAALGAVLAGVGALLGYGPVNRGADAASDGIGRVRDGASDEASAQLREAEAAFADADAVFSAPWLWPAMVVPGVAQHVDALATMSRNGRDVSAAAAAVTEQVDYEDLRYLDGRIDLATVAAAQEPLDTAAATFASAREELDAQRGSLLLPPVDDAVDRFAAELDEAAPQSAVAASTAQLAPGLLGADGPRRYAVLFTTPAELRGLGGFVGSWAILEAHDGEVELVETLRTDELNAVAGREEREVVVPDDAEPDEQARLTDYVNRYGRFNVGRYLQDVTFSPDLPTVGAVVEQLWPQVGQEPIDGVVVADPAGLAALLELTGPVEVPDTDIVLDADNVEDFLLTEQYTAFPDSGAREDFLGEVGRLTFEKLVSGSLPSPRRLGEVVSPAVAGGHLAMWSSHPEEAALLASVGASGAFPDAAGHDLLSVRTQNKGQNKIDVYQRREIDQSVQFDPETGETSSTVRITLHNDAPAEGLPLAVIGSNDQGLPLGTNQAFVSVYTPLALRSARIDGDGTGMEFQRELGVSVYSRFVTIPPGGSVVLDLELGGRLEPGEYRLVLAPQPMVEPDRYDLALTAAAGWTVADVEAGVLEVRADGAAGRATGGGTPAAVAQIVAEFARP